MKKAKKASQSITTLGFLALPSHANPAGKVHGGEIMKLIDSTAAAAAMKHTGMNVVTARVRELTFENPSEIGNLITAEAAVIYRYERSLVVRVNVMAEDLEAGEIMLVSKATLIFVPVIEGRSAKVPKLIPDTDELKKEYDQEEKLMVADMMKNLPLLKVIKQLE